MKRLFTLIVLLGMAVGVLTGCNESGSTSSPADTNAPPSTSTNK